MIYTRQAARLDLSNADDLFTAEKSIGLSPASGELYAQTVGWVDGTVFYEAKVTPEEVAWLRKLPEVTRFTAPGHAPSWWKWSLWRHGRDPGMKYFRTDAKWPCIFVYSVRSHTLFGSMELE